MLPAIISQFVTVIKDTSLLYSVIALQELFGASQILMGSYFEPEQVFSLYILIALIYFSFNLAISSLSHMLAKRSGNKLQNKQQLSNSIGEFFLMIVNIYRSQFDTILFL